MLNFDYDNEQIFFQQKIAHKKHKPIITFYKE